MTEDRTPGTLYSARNLTYGLRSAGDAQLSPDGSLLTYGVRRADASTGRQLTELWLSDGAGSNPRRLSSDRERVGGARWSPSGSSIAYTAADGQAGLLLIAEGPEFDSPREVTRHAQGIGGLDWSADGSRIAYTTTFDPDNPEESPAKPGAAPKVKVTTSVSYKSDGRGFVGNRRGHVFVVDLGTGKRERLNAGAFDHANPRWSPDGTQIAVQVGTGPMSSRLVLINVDSGAHEAITPEFGSVDQWAWSPDGGRIIYSGDPDHTAQADLFLYDVTTGETRQLTNDLESQPAAGGPLWGIPAFPIWLNDREVVFTSIRSGASRVEVIDVESGALRIVAGDQTRNSGLSLDSSKRFTAQAVSTLDSPSEVGIFDRELGSWQIVTQSNPEFSVSPRITWERLEVQRGRFAVEGWLLKPPDFDPARKYPLILDVHGGPSMAYGYSFMEQQQVLAGNGFLVLIANPRGSTSYGRAFAEAQNGDCGGEDYQDLLAIVDKALERPFVDPDRVGIFGYSYGGFMVAWAIGHTDRFKAAVCGAPVFDWVTKYGTSDIGPRQGQLQFGGMPFEVPEIYAARSPSTFAHNSKTPTLIIQGEADERCPIGQGQQMFIALKDAGCEAELALYPESSHMFFAVGKPEYREDFLVRVLSWFKERL